MGKHGKTEPVGKFALMEESTGRYHITIKAGMPRPDIRRIARLIIAHSKTNPDSKLNVMQDGREKTHGLVRDLTYKKLTEIIATATLSGGGSLVVVSEKVGGALSSKFWKHPTITKLLSRR